MLMRMLPAYLAMFFADASGVFLAPIFAFAMIFWVWMLVDCARFEKEGSTKIAWLLIMLFVNVVGAPLYYFFRRLPRLRETQYQTPPGILQPWRHR